MKTNSKKLFALIMSVIMLMGIVPAGILSASAADTNKSGTCGENLTWTLDDEGTLTISGTGDMYNYGGIDIGSAPWDSLRNSIKTVNISDSVTSIGSDAFNACSSLTSITIPDSVTSIGSCAFNGCWSLTSITIPDSVTSIGFVAFGDCTGLKSIIVPDSITNIDKDAFSTVNNVLYSQNMKAAGSPWGAKCVNGYEDGIFVYSNSSKDKLCGCFSTAIGSIIIPDSVTIIGDRAFEGCRDLTGIDIPNGVTKIGKGAFERCNNLTSITIPDNVTNIDRSTFEACNSLKNVYIPNGIKSIGEYAFYNCASLENVTFGKGSILTNIGVSAFRECKNLTSVTIPDRVKSIENAAFFNCSSLKSIIIPESVTSIGSEAFFKCKKLESIILSDNITSIGSYAFDETEYYNNKDNWTDNMLYLSNYLVRAEKSIDSPVTIKDGTKLICGSAFSECKNITSITIPNSVKSICEDAFDWCTNLTNIAIPNSVINIENFVFSRCKKLTSVIIPDSVTSIGEYAFYDCSSLEYVHIPSSVKEIGEELLFWCYNAYICSDSTNCYAATYAGKNFVHCSGHNNLDNIEVEAITKTDKANDVTAVFDTNTFAEDVNLFVEEIKSEDKKFGSYKLNADDIQYGLFEIHMVNSKGEYIQPQSGKVTLKIPIPEGVKVSDYSSLYVAHIKQNGITEKYTVSEGELRIEGKYLVFEITSFSTFAICKEEKNSSVSDIVINVAAATSVDYRSKVTIKATATGVPSNYYLAIYVNGKQVAKGDNKEVSYMLGEAKSDINYAVKVVDAKGNVQKDASGKDLAKDSKVTVNSSFFKKLIAFFKGLFGMLPTVTIKP